MEFETFETEQAFDPNVKQQITKQTYKYQQSKRIQHSTVLLSTDYMPDNK